MLTGRTWRAVLLAAALGGGVAGPLGAQPEAPQGAPLSAIDWLSRSVEPAAPAPVVAPRAIDEPPVAQSAETPQVTTAPLDLTSVEAVGILPPELTGLPRSLWSASPEDGLVLLLRAARVETLPALQDLMMTLMLAEADPPQDAGASTGLFLSRVDKLLDLGALEPAQALLEAAGPETDPELFRRWFDVSLLTGTEDAPCEMLRDRPGLAPTLPARVFCLARNGDWNAAALTLNTARVLGDVTPEDEALLSRFLDPDLFEGMPPLPPPARPNPLDFRMREAIGEGLATQALPRAFAHADLRDTVAWRNQLEAAERLARSGAVPDNRLLAIYTARTPAASGGVWDRAAAFQALDRALATGEAAAVAAALPRAWQAARTARIEVPLARLTAEALGALAPELGAETQDLAFRIALLSGGYEAAALDHTGPVTPRTALWIAVATGDTRDLPAQSDPRAAAIAAAFAGAEVPAPFSGQIAAGRLGEVLLRAIAALQQGLDGDPGAITDALVVFRAVGLEDVARRTALQILLLDRAP